MAIPTNQEWVGAMGVKMMRAGVNIVIDTPVY